MQIQNTYALLEKRVKKHTKKGEVMSKIKTRNKWVFVAFCALFLAFIFSNNTFAAGSGIVENGDARWEYILEDATAEKPQQLTIKYYDKTPSATTVVVPSLDWLKNNVPGASADLDTYLLKNANSTQQDANYPSFTRRAPTADTTKLDMTNTSKIQIFGVKPMINPSIETELIFGSNMVIGESGRDLKVTVSTCKMDPQYYEEEYNDILCLKSTDIEIDHFEQYVPGWDDMSEAEQEAYTPTYQQVADLRGCQVIWGGWVAPADSYDWNACYIVESEPLQSETQIAGKAFGGYKLKLTNFVSSNFNYIGWGAFANSTFNEANTSIVIDGNVYGGSNIFANTNIKNITINTSNTGAGLFRDCQHIESVTFGSGIDTIIEDTFAGTNLTSFDFGAHGIKHIKARAFEGADLGSIDLTGVERLDYRAFRKTALTEVYLPKSINYLEVEVFRESSGLKKVTVAYDTQRSGMIHPLSEVFGVAEYHSSVLDADSKVEELVVLAPYGQDEQVAADHLTVDEYLYHYDDEMNYHAEERPRYCLGVSSNANYWYFIYPEWNADVTYACGKQLVEPEKQWAKPDEKKNVIAPMYFANFHNIRKITVGDGYEHIGISSFNDPRSDGFSWSFGGYDRCSKSDTNCQNAKYRRIEKIDIADSVKSIGALAFGKAWYPNMEVNIPRNIEFIGQAAFKQMFTLEIDVDFPNLKFLGDDAFTGTLVRNIHLYDSLEYMGWYVFHECAGIRDIIFDLDFFNPDNMILASKALLDDESWSKFGGSEGNVYKKFLSQFGGESISRTQWSAETQAEWGLASAESCNYGYCQKYGKIVFTEKAVTAPYVQAASGYRYSGIIDSDIVADPNASGPGDDISMSGPTGHYFGQVNASEVDFGATPWKAISPFIFHHGQIGKLTLPSGVETIGAMAFTDALIEEEVVLPSTLKVIGDGAFFCNASQYRNCGDGITIKDLPEGLEYIGDRAFWGDKNLTASLHSPNLKRLGYEAFRDTRLVDVYIPDTLEFLRPGTFARIPTLRDITIDADWARIASAPYAGPETYDSFPQSLIDYTEGLYPTWKVLDRNFIPDPQGSGATETVETFYTVFNKTEMYGTCEDQVFVPGYGWRYINCSGQIEAGDEYGSLVFTDKNVTEIDGSTGYFSGLTFGTVDMGATSWAKITEQPYAFANANIGTLILPGGLKTVTEGAFHDAVIGETFVMPTTIKTIDRAAFQGATGTISNALPEGLKTINEAAFYEAAMADDLVIPSTVEHIGRSAFNAGSQDVHYGTVTIKPNLDFAKTDSQLVHQFLWGSSLDKLVVESSALPALSANISETGHQEFWNMDMDEVVLKNLTGISYAAFEGCTNLKKVDATGDPDLVMIGEQAFVDDEKLDTFLFAPGSKNKVITIKPNAFSGTAFTELGDSNSSFDLTAAKFDATPGHSFANMPKLKKVTVPRNFSGATIPEYTFYNDALLEEAIVDYKITDIKNAAFAKDDNLKRIFIWGDTIVQDQSLDGYTPPTRGPSPTVVGPTIPEVTDIYAYSTAKTEDYAASEQRAGFAGKFYPLDEVLYLTSNHPIVLLNEDDTDFDKSDLVVYAMRRDGVILESDSWQEFDGNAYSRAGKGLTFEHMAETIAEDEAFGTVWDTPVPMNELDITNQNFANLAYSIRPAADDPAILTVNLVHTDKYTTNPADTDVDPRDYVPEPIPDPTPDPEPQPEPQPDTPKTLDEIAKYVAILVGSGIAAAAIYFVVRKRR